MKRKDKDIKKITIKDFLLSKEKVEDLLNDIDLHIIDQEGSFNNSCGDICSVAFSKGDFPEEYYDALTEFEKIFKD